MPELPEVETVKRSLEPLLHNKTILEAVVRYPGVIKNPPLPKFQKLIRGRDILGIKRRGKYLLFSLSGGYTLIIHLRMTGRIVVCDSGDPVSKHTHLVFPLSDGHDMRFADVRKFGMIYLVPDGQWQEIAGLAGIGIEPLDAGFTPERLAGLLRGVRKGIKAFLLDQTKIAGIGNIYADEILHEAGLHPERTAGGLDPQETQILYNAIRSKLAEGIAYRGTSVRDYVDGRGEKGGFQERLQVYDRGGQPCRKCGRPLLKKVIAGRGTVYCPCCQHLTDREPDREPE